MVNLFNQTTDYIQSENTNSKESLISIILPVYNGEKYLIDTLNSIQAQTYVNFEVLCINDGSTDGSLSLLNERALSDKRFKIHSKPNQGTAVSGLVFALPYVNGEYLFYSSQDDLFSPDLLEKMYHRALETSADAVLPDMVWYVSMGISKSIIGNNGDRSAILTGREAFLKSLNWDIHGFSLRRMSLVKKLGYSLFPMNSDEIVTRKFYLDSNMVVFSEGTFYYRQDNFNSITKSISDKTFEIAYAELAVAKLALKEKFEKDTCWSIIQRGINIVINQYQYLKSNTSSIKKTSINAAKRTLAIVNFKLVRLALNHGMLFLVLTMYAQELLNRIKGLLKSVLQ